YLITTEDRGQSVMLKCALNVRDLALPFDAYLALRGLKTLALRMAAQCSNAAQVAKYLSTHPKVEQVYYPGLASHPQHELCKKQMRTGGAVVTINLKGDIEDTKIFLSKVKYFVLAESLGGVESMVNHSATMSHGSMTKEERESIHVYDTTLRLSVGIEDITDLLNDLENALS
ncbi:PLP-dependent transferase, partial [Providencia huaxiensis]|uniref:PLP-dependent transferase n=1 Tax=Providencia huaxiensis TaxID=2027290 RepID=UPI0034E42E97